MSNDGLPAPRANPHLIGHEKAWRVLERQSAKGRGPHAWLLSGMRGIGKSTLAYRFARHLLAPVGETEVSQNPESALFRSVAHGSHPDLHILKRRHHPRTGKLQSEIPVDAVRASSEALRATSARGGCRLLLIDAIDDLNRNAANALLKLLEEPPLLAAIIMVCHAPGSVPQTVLSRCARLRLLPLSLADTEAVLGLAVPSVSNRTRAALARIAGGSPGRALAFFGSGFVRLYGEALQIIADDRIDPGERAQRSLKMLRAAQEDASLSHLLDIPLAICHRCMLLQLGESIEPPIVNDEEQYLRGIANGVPLDHLPALWEKLARLPRHVDLLNLDQRQSLLLALHALCAAPSETREA